MPELFAFDRGKRAVHAVENDAVHLEESARPPGGVSKQIRIKHDRRLKAGRAIGERNDDALVRDVRRRLTLHGSREERAVVHVEPTIAGRFLP